MLCTDFRTATSQHLPEETTRCDEYDITYAKWVENITIPPKWKHLAKRSMFHGRVFFSSCVAPLPRRARLCVAALAQLKKPGPEPVAWDRDGLLATLTRPSLLNIYFPASLDEKPFCFCEV